MNNNVVKKVHPIISGWKGELPLWQAYWIYFVCGNYAISSIDDFILSYKNFYVNIIYLIFVLAFLVWSIVSVWKSAFNTKHKYWGYIARVIVIIGPLGAVVNEVYS